MSFPNWFASVIAWIVEEDWVVLIPSAILLFVLLAVAGLWYWFWLFMGTIGLVLGFEWAATKLTGNSISDQFREWKKNHMVMARSILFAFAFFGLSLIFHLCVNIK